jgi:hypothetical protein
MSLSRRSPAFIAWIACLAIALNALAPTASRLLAIAGAAQAESICTSAGARTAAPGAAGQGSAPALALEHCPFCLPHAGTFALPPAPPSLRLPVLHGPDWHPFLFLHSPRPLFQWAAGQPRAPPARA